MLTTKACLSICKLKAAMLFIVGFVVFSCNEDDFLSLSVNELNIPVDGKETTFRMFIWTKRLPWLNGSRSLFRVNMHRDSIKQHG